MKKVGQQLDQTELELSELRSAIDSLDQTIASLLNERLTVAARIGELKKRSGIAVKEKGREQKVLQNVASHGSTPQISQAIETIYSSVIAESCKVQTRLETPQAANPYFPRVLIVGLGAIGGALAKQIRKRLPHTCISAVDERSILDDAMAQGLIDSAESELTRAVAKAQLILLCATPNENLRILRQIVPFTKRPQVIMDVTSTKEHICRLAEELPLKADFVGGHPFFGSHLSGLSASASVVVEGQRFCMSATKRSGELTLRRVRRWLTDLGLQPVTSSAVQHDAAVARTSHTVQLMAVALGAAIANGRSDEELAMIAKLSGPGFGSLARLMSSPPVLWMDIIQQNKVPIGEALTEVILEMNRMRNAVTSGELDPLRSCFDDARRISAAVKEC